MPEARAAGGLIFEALFPVLDALPGLPPLRTFRARDGAQLPYRHYPGGSSTDLILFHGSAGHGAYLCKLARIISGAGAANVYTPDIRGHGIDPPRRGDIDYVEQLEDDLADLIAHIRAMGSAQRRIVVGGHSSGGGLAVRFAGGRHGYLASGYLLIAPYLGHDAPTVRRNAGGWVRPSLGKIVAIAILSGFGIKRWDGAPVLRFNVPEKYRTGTETLTYSWRLMTGFNPTGYRRELAAVKVPLCVLIGAGDEAFHAARFESAIRDAAPAASVRLVPGATHLGIIASDECAALAVEWLRGLG